MRNLRKLLLVLPFVLLVASCSRDPKQQAQRYLSNGNKFFDKGKYKEASIMYRRALQKDLRYGEAYYRLGLVDLKLSAYGDAVRSLRRAVELQPDNSDAAGKLADIYVMASVQDPAHATELRDQARELATNLLQRNPNSFDGHRLMGQILLLENNPPKAITELEAAYQLQPKPEISLELFQAYVSNKEQDRAESLARSVIEKNKSFAAIYDLQYVLDVQNKKMAEAEQILKLKVTNNPKQPNYLVQLANHYFITQRRDEMNSVIQQLSDEKQFVEGHLLAGDFYLFRARDFDAAKTQFEAGAKSNPKDKATYQKRLVELYATVGRNQEANQLLNAVLAQSPKDSEAIALRAALTLQTGNREQISQAANDLQSLVAKTPDNHILRFNLARAYLAKNDLEQARMQLEAAIKIRPDFVLAHELLGRVYLAKGDATKALKEADDTIAINPNDVQARLQRSSALLSIGDKEKARQELDVIQKLSPDNPDARFQVGYLDWAGKDYKQAEQVFSDLYKANPNDLRGLTGVIEALLSEKRYDEAIRQLQAAIAKAKEPQLQNLQLALANVDIRAEPPRYDEAIQIYQKLLQTNPKSNVLLYQLAETERRKGDVNTAIDMFRRATQANPNDIAPLLELGLLMDGTGRRDQAKPIYEQILKIAPDHPVALNNLAFIKAEEGADLDEALTMAQRARQKMPNSPDVQDTLGWIYIKKNLSDDAVRVFKGLVQEHPANPSFHFHYGMALLQKGDKPSAKREFELAIKNNPSRDDAGKIKQLLAAN